MLTGPELEHARLEASHARLARIRELLAEQDLDAIYLRDLTNITWASAFDGVFDDEPAHALFITQDRACLHSDSRYVQALEEAAVRSEIEISIEPGGHEKWLSSLIEPSFRIGIEDTMTLREFGVLEDLLADMESPIVLIRTTDLIEGLRSVKDDLEIALMREAQRITDASFEYIVNFIKVGMTEVQVQRALDAFMLEQGATGLAFATIVAAGEHAASPHAIPSDRAIEAGDAVVMDFGARFGGYCSDMTRTVFIGEPTETMRRAWDTMCMANKRCEEAICAGKTGAEIHALAEEILAQGGFAKKMGHGLGHSLGLFIHERPTLSLGNSDPLPAGAVLTVEPGIYLPGEFGMRLEDFGVVTETGFEVITQSTHEMVIIDPLSR
jgi:Xaa-Pro aminopeptidase